MTPLYLFLVTQTEVKGKDTFGGMVVVAENEDQAKRIHPQNMLDLYWSEESNSWERMDYFGGDKSSTEKYSRPWLSGTWANQLKNITAKLLGTAAEGVEAGRVLDSYYFE